MITLTELAEIVSKEVSVAMLEKYNSVPSIIPEIANVMPVPIDGSVLGDKGAVISDLDYMNEREQGQDYVNDRMRTSHVWQLKVREFSKRIPVDRRLLAADSANKQLIADWIRRGQQIGESARKTKELLVANMFQKGTLTAGSQDHFDNTYANNVDPYPKFIYDGLPWFDGAHLDLTGASYSNIQTSLSLTHANLETMNILTDQTNAKNSRRLPVSVSHNVLLVPINLRATAERIVNSERVAGTGNNDVNPMRNRYKVVAWNMLTDDTDAWWTVQAKSGLEVYDSGAPRTRIEDRPGTPFVDIVIDTFFGATVSDWRFAASANKADS